MEQELSDCLNIMWMTNSRMDRCSDKLVRMQLTYLQIESEIAFLKARLYCERYGKYDILPFLQEYREFKKMTRGIIQ